MHYTEFLCWSFPSNLGSQSVFIPFQRELAIINVASSNPCLSRKQRAQKARMKLHRLLQFPSLKAFPLPLPIPFPFPSLPSEILPAPLLYQHNRVYGDAGQGKNAQKMIK